MGWADYHRVRVSSAVEGLQAARGLVKACAVGPVFVQLEVEDTDRATLARLSAALPDSGVRRVEQLLVADDPLALIARARRVGSVEVQGRTGGVWVTATTEPWPDEPRSVTLRVEGPDALSRASEIEGESLACRVELDPEDADGLVAADVPGVIQWWCGFDDHGAAYHGVRLALHGRYADGRLAPVIPGHYELVVLVSGKRPDAAAVVSRIATATGLSFVWEGSGL